MEKNSTCKALINHISRLEGQLGSIKKELQRQDADCIKASATLRASSRSFASLKQAFVAYFFMVKFFSQQANTAKGSREYAALLDLIRS